jgi:hypothetical protein
VILDRLLKRRPAPAEPSTLTDEWLRKQTGRGAEWWVEYVQREIWEHVLEGEDGKVHPEIDVVGWQRRVVGIVELSRPDGEYDENIRGALVLGVVMLLWGMRISRAKAYDPNRPLELRQRALRRWSAMMAIVVDAVTNESLDHRFFEGQGWDPPFAPGARDGDFV